MRSRRLSGRSLLRRPARSREANNRDRRDRIKTSGKNRNRLHQCSRTRLVHGCLQAYCGERARPTAMRSPREWDSGKRDGENSASTRWRRPGQHKNGGIRPRMWDRSELCRSKRSCSIISVPGSTVTKRASGVSSGIFVHQRSSGPQKSHSAGSGLDALPFGGQE